MTSEAGAVDASASVLLDDDGNATAAIIKLPAGSDEADSNSADNDGISDAVAIAAIEADTTVAVASIHAEVETARIEAQAEQEQATWQDYQNLTERVTNLTALVETMTAAMVSLSPPQALEVEAEPGTETTLTITPETQTEASSEIRTEALDESEDESPDPDLPEVPAVRVRVRAI